MNAASLTKVNEVNKVNKVNKVTLDSNIHGVVQGKKKPKNSLANNAT